MSESPRVFISYSHQDSEYENRILDFTNKLRAEGIDANVDLYEESPADGWPRWMENQIQEATYVLVFAANLTTTSFALQTREKESHGRPASFIRTYMMPNVKTQNSFPLSFPRMKFHIF